ncbi:RecX family transcriptional regulator [Gordonibacter pamelaeae]|uniref:regulatory protein RecX n=1 Tax=Gordonibacter pamelaeae TaxID=471189 RepID=UPI002109721E|nr:regulatory protein RecX [Gordonibacter pamelaeae]MCQ4848144.1 RecX family transcriptional regulator [Gordonibacter pamelaeae]MCQ4849395.1 RecX family transcriptional regulator [Gordonibacter pamelaeae]
MSDAAEVRARLRAQIAAIEASPSACKGDAGREAPCPSPEDAQVLRGALDPLQEDDGLCAASGSLARSRGGGVPPAASVEASAADGAERAFRKIERLALAREQASAALRARLAREGFAPEAADAAVDRALSCGLVDDARYAEVLVRSRLSQGRGAQGIAAELDALGIDASVVPGWPEEFAVDHESEVERALALLDRKPPRAKNRRDAAFRRLVQKGFGASVASTAARVWSEGEECQ